MASLKQLDERRYKITVSNGYRPDGRKVCKARTLHVPKRIPRRSVLQYVMHAAEELEKEFKYGYAEDGEKTFEAYARGWLERQTHYAPSTLAGYRQMLERVYGEIGQIRLKELRPITIEYLLERLRKQPGPSGRQLGCALPGFVDSKNEEKTERNAGYLVVSHSGGGMLRQGTRKGIRRTPANRGMRAHWVVKGLDISEDVCHGMCP